jgi:Protein of unknown function (DUF3108)
MRRSVSVVMITLAFAFWAAGCYRSASKVVEPPPIVHAPAAEQPATMTPPEATGAGGEKQAGAEGNASAKPAGTASAAVSGLPQGEEAPPPATEAAPSPGIEGSHPPPGASSGGTGEAPPGTAGGTESERRMEQERPPLPENAPSFAREHEELVYRVEFLGLTMGYARFRFRGIVRTEGKLAYHLTVRAWTSDLLSVFYPMNDTIEYYLDVDTLAPIRQEFTNSRSEDDIAYYDQKTGKIVYRYKKNGKVRKQIQAVPGVYDPVSAVYYFRTRSLVGEEPPRPMYVGRKLWEISVKPAGVATIRTEGGPFDTVVIEPVIRRGEKQEHQGNIRVWMTRDARHVPVRLYAKFKKVRTWTLVGILLPKEQGE